MTDYIPHSYANLAAWLAKQPTELTTTLAAAIGMTTAERDAFLANCTTLATPLGEIVDLMQQLEEKTADFEPLLAAQLPLIRKAIKRRE